MECFSPMVWVNDQEVSRWTKIVILPLELLPSCRVWWFGHCPAPSAPPPMRRVWSKQGSWHKPIVFCHLLTTGKHPGWWSGAMKRQQSCETVLWSILMSVMSSHWLLTSLARRRSDLRSFLLSIRRCLVVRRVTLFLNLTACLATMVWW